MHSIYVKYDKIRLSITVLSKGVLEMNKTIIVAGSVLLIAATILDLKCKGLGYKMLPQSVQQKVDRYM